MLIISIAEMARALREVAHTRSGGQNLAEHVVVVGVEGRPHDSSDLHQEPRQQCLVLA